METKNIILEILENNDISELYVEDSSTVMEMENTIQSTPNPENSKIQEIPIMHIANWIQYLKDHNDVIEIIDSYSAFVSSRSGINELKISLKLKLKGALKHPKKDLAFEQVFSPVEDTLLKLLAESLSYKLYVEQLSAQEKETDSEESNNTEHESDMDSDTSLAQSALS